MKQNIGAADKSVRIGLAILFIVLYFTKAVTGTLGIVLVVLAAVLVLTSLISFCPLYLLPGISTNKIAKKQE